MRLKDASGNLRRKEAQKNLCLSAVKSPEQFVPSHPEIRQVQNVRCYIICRIPET